MNRKPFSSAMSGNAIEVIEELKNTPHMPEWYWFQPELAFKPIGIVVWGGVGLIHSFRVGLEEQLMGDVPCDMFRSPHTLDELKLRAKAGVLIRSFNTTQLVLPTMSPSSRINMHVSGNPTAVAIYGIQLAES
jgi:hypothetical protein